MSAPVLEAPAAAPQSTLLHKARLRRWYKVDVSGGGGVMVYDVWVDDVLRADDAPIEERAPWTREATGVNRLGVYAHSAARSRWSATRDPERPWPAPQRLARSAAQKREEGAPSSRRRGRTQKDGTPRTWGSRGDSRAGGRRRRARCEREISPIHAARAPLNSVDRLDNAGWWPTGAGLVDFEAGDELRTPVAGVAGRRARHAGALRDAGGRRGPRAARADARRHAAGAGGQGQRRRRHARARSIDKSARGAALRLPRDDARADDAAAPSHTTPRCAPRSGSRMGRPTRPPGTAPRRAPRGR